MTIKVLMQRKRAHKHQNNITYVCAPFLYYHRIEVIPTKRSEGGIYKMNTPKIIIVLKEINGHGFIQMAMKCIKLL